MTDISHYDYELPRALIAQEPLTNRTDARLLVVDRTNKRISHRKIHDLPQLLAPGDCLVLNNTRVIPARLVGRRERTGGRWTGLFLEAHENGLWRVLCKTRGKAQPEEWIVLEDRNAREALRLQLVSRQEGGGWLVRPESNEAPVEILKAIGRVPLPHYIRGGEMTDSDLKTYQTVFAEKDGAVAAPTAGLHFTPRLLEKIQKRGIERALVTLHVGIGTFQPIKTEDVSQHVMHGEWGTIDAVTVQQLRNTKQKGGRIVAVGTTAVRVLETAAAEGTLTAWTGETKLYIHPPYTFHAVDVLLTNFHLPRTSLLVLARTFGGDELIRCAYQEAIAQEYRFFSYGDAMLIL